MIMRAAASLVREGGRTLKEQGNRYHRRAIELFWNPFHAPKITQHDKWKEQLPPTKPDSCPILAAWLHGCFLFVVLTSMNIYMCEPVYYLAPA
jgi:hypothetical protein